MKRAFLVVLLVAACSGSLTSPDVDCILEGGVTLAIVSGNNQVCAVADTLEPCVVKITVGAIGASGDKDDRPVQGVLVNFIVTEGGGHVFAGAALTDSAGLAAELWILGTTAGAQSMEARAVKSDGTPVVYDVFKATAEPGPISTWSGSYVTHGDWGAFVGDSINMAEGIPPLLTPKDAYGNVITDPEYTLIPSSILVSWNPPIMTASTEVRETPEIWIERTDGSTNINTPEVVPGGYSWNISFSFLYDLREWNMTIDGAPVDTLYYTPDFLTSFLVTTGCMTMTVITAEKDMLYLLQIPDAILETSTLYGSASHSNYPRPNIIATEPRTYEANMLDGSTRIIVITPKP